MNLEQLQNYDSQMKAWVAGRAPANTQEQLNALDARLDAAEGDISTIEGQVSTIQGNVSQNTSDIASLQGTVAGLASATHFRGKVNDLADVRNPANGDIVIVGNQEYIYLIPEGASGGSWEPFGETSDEANRITALEGRMTTVEATANSAVQGGSGQNGTNTTATVTKEGTTLKVKVDVSGASTIGTSESATTLPTTGAVVKAINALDGTSSDPGTIANIVTDVSQTNGKVTVKKTTFTAITEEEINALFA